MLSFCFTALVWIVNLRKVRAERCDIRGIPRARTNKRSCTCLWVSDIEKWQKFSKKVIYLVVNCYLNAVAYIEVAFLSTIWLLLRMIVIRHLNVGLWFDTLCYIILALQCFKLTFVHATACTRKTEKETANQYQKGNRHELRNLSIFEANILWRRCV